MQVAESSVSNLQLLIQHPQYSLQIAECKKKYDLTNVAKCKYSETETRQSALNATAKIGHYGIH